MLTTEFSETKKAWIDLQQQVNYWKARHAKATRREAQWKKTAQDFERTVKLQSVGIENLTKQVEELTAQVVWLKQRLPVFTRTSIWSANRTRQGLRKQ
jgi:hypothetical protein